MPKGRVASAVGVTIVALAATGSLGRAGICPCGPPYAGVLVGIAPAVPSVWDPVVTVDRQGRVVAAGVTQGETVGRLVVVRYRPDGSLDPSFGDGGVASSSAREALLHAVAVDGDGRVVVGGTGIAATGSGGLAVTRLTADGSPDSGFGAGGTTTVPLSTLGGTAFALRPLPDGGVAVAGGSPPSNGNAVVALVRLRGDGSLDPAFGDGGTSLDPLPMVPHAGTAIVGAGFDAAGRIAVAGDAGGLFLARYLPDGRPDPSFGSGGREVEQVAANEFVESVAVAPDGSVVLGGRAGSGSAVAVTVRRFRPDGAPDLGFGSAGAVTLAPLGSGNRPPRVAFAPDGSLAVSADLGSGAGGTLSTALTVLGADGRPAPTFGGSGRVVVPLANPSGIAVEPDGALVLAGGGPTLRVERYDADGTPDTSFVTDPPVVERGGANAVALESDGTAIAAGWTVDHGRRLLALLALRPTAGLDTAFGAGGRAVAPTGAGDAEAAALVRLSDGRLLAAGGAGARGVLAEFGADGRLEPSFGSGGVVLTASGAIDALAVLPDGRILVVADGLASRYTASGSLDATFELPFAASALAALPDGRILVAGAQRGTFALARLLSTGALDPTFGQAGIAAGPPGSANALAVDPVGRILVAGSGFDVARYTPDGALDPAFGVGGVAAPPVAGGDASSVVAQQDGAVAVAGSVTVADGTRRFGVARLDEFGYVDETFGPPGSGGVVTTDVGSPAGIRALALGDNAIVAAGIAPTTGGTRAVVARYLESVSTGVGAGSPLTAIGVHRTRALTRGGVVAPAISPDGRSIAYEAPSNGRLELFVVPASGGAPRRLTSSPFGKDTVAGTGVSWSPDGRTIAFDAIGRVPDPRCTHACRTQDVLAVGLRDTTVHLLAANAHGASWSGDGRHVAYLATPGADGRTAVVVADADGRDPRRVAVGLLCEWAPRRGPLAVDTFKGDLALVAASGRRLRTLRRLGFGAWSRDGRTLAVFAPTSGGEQTNLLVVGARGGRPRLVMGGYALTSPSFSPDGRRIAVFAQRAGAGVLVVRDVRTGTLLRRVWTTRSASPPMWSPDGETVTIGG